MPGVLDVVGFLFNDKPRTRIEGDVSIPLDAAIAVTHDYQIDVTDNVVEDGSVVQDHAVRRPDELSIEGFVSDSPVEILGGLLSGSVSGLGGFVGGLIGNEPKSKTAYNLLLKAINDKALLDVVTRFKMFKSMIITKASVPQNPGNGEAIRFTMTLRHFRTVKSQTSTALDSLLADVQDIAGPVASRGRQAANIPARNMRIGTGGRILPSQEL